MSVNQAGSLKVLYLCTPDENAARLAGMLSPWCGDPVQCFRGDARGVDGVGPAELIDDLHRDLFRDVQKHWFQLVSSDFDIVGRKRPESWSEPALTAMSNLDRWLLSDPRFCHTAPFWQARLRPDINVIAYSEPLAAAVSLSRTWRFPIGVGIALWEHYLLSAVTNCERRSVLLLSVNLLRSNRTLFNRLFARQMAALGYAENDILKQIESTPGSNFAEVDLSGIDPQDYLNDDQGNMFAELEALDLDAVACRLLSARSRDLLRHYGDLRAGYETMKLQRNELRQMLNDIKADRANRRTGEETGREGAVVRVEPDQEAGDYVEVSLQVKDMQHLEFICRKDAPILNTLQTVLRNPREYGDKLVFLNYGRDGERTLYFPGASLFALEIAAV